MQVAAQLAQVQGLASMGLKSLLHGALVQGHPLDASGLFYPLIFGLVLSEWYQYHGFLFRVCLGSPQGIRAHVVCQAYLANCCAIVSRFSRPVRFFFVHESTEQACLELIAFIYRVRVIEGRQGSAAAFKLQSRRINRATFFDAGFLVSNPAHILSVLLGLGGLRIFFP